MHLLVFDTGKVMTPVTGRNYIFVGGDFVEDAIMHFLHLAVPLGLADQCQTKPFSFQCSHHH